MVDLAPDPEGIKPVMPQLLIYSSASNP